jgi:large-conductance mechanosensitive channel
MAHPLVQTIPQQSQGIQQGIASGAQSIKNNLEQVGNQMGQVGNQMGQVGNKVGSSIKNITSGLVHNKHVSGYLEFLQKFNVFGLGLGFICATALNKIVETFSKDVLMPSIEPFLRRLTGGKGGDKMKIKLGPVHIQLADFINAVVQFVVITLFVFIVIVAVGAKAEPPQTKVDLITIPWENIAKHVQGVKP